MIKLENISKYRGELMGFAMIIVILFHITVGRMSPWYGLHRMGNMGVDIFFFVSGLGLWYSWTGALSHSNGEGLWYHVKTFYQKRLVRIYPAWLIIAGYYYVSRFNFETANFGAWKNLIMQVLFNWNFWLYDELTFWYVPATMMLYLFAPWFMELLRRNRAWAWLIALPFMWSIMVQYITPLHQAFGHIEIFWSRIPIFMLGIILADSVKNKTVLPREMWVMVAVFFIFSFGSCVWLEQMKHGRFPIFLERWLYIAFAVSTMLIMSEAFDRAKAITVKGISIVNKAFIFVGGLSLEIYLCHTQFVMFPIERQWTTDYWAVFVLTLAISLPVSWVISKICARITKAVTMVLHIGRQ